jgi:DNA/RNA endonuclease G (NUC1)
VTTVDHAKLRSYLAQVAPEKGNVESYREHNDVLEAALDIAPVPEPLRGQEADLVAGALRAVERDEALTDDQAQALEAIVLPKERPVIDVTDGTFATPDPPFAHFGLAAVRQIIEKTVPAVGRIELPGHPSLPFGGTAFVVGDGLMMTNRHVAELFASGLGREGLAFLPGRDAGVDFLRERDRDESLLFAVDRVLMVHPYWDMALVAVNGLPAAQPTLRLATAEPGDLLDREVAIIGYPALDPRNNVELQDMIFRGVFNVKRLQPGRVGARAEFKSFGNAVMSLTHDCSTLGGNSGSAVVDAQTGSVLALHFAGRYLEANYAVPAHAFSLDQRVVDAGVAFDGEVRPPARTEWEDFWALADPTPTVPTGPAGGEPRHPPRDESGASSAPTGSAPPAASPTTTEQRVVLNVPLDISIRVGTPDTGTPPIAVTATALTGGMEAVVEPIHDEDLHSRTGYDEMFLGAPLLLPEVLAGVPVSRLDDDSIELSYEHFSAVMNKDRRLAHFLAASVDGRPSKTAPEPGRDYTRTGLGGLGRNDREKWFTDPRIPANHQLPDRFFNRDRGSFDKGHIIRRTYVAWGDSYDQVRRANGDTYHVTNCSPQIAAFNQSSRQGVWGKLEDLVQTQAAAETYSVFAGPIFRDDDPPFEGVDDRGRTTVQIPRSFWKVIVARSEGGLQTFAFELDQDLSGVDFTELAFNALWRTRMIPVRDLETAIRTLHFPEVLTDTDQSDTDLGESIRRQAGS